MPAAASATKSVSHRVFVFGVVSCGLMAGLINWSNSPELCCDNSTEGMLLLEYILSKITGVGAAWGVAVMGEKAVCGVAVWSA